MSENTEKVTGIGGIFFKVKDPAQMAVWYRDQLGINTEGGFAELERTIWSLFPADTDHFGPGRPAFMINYRVANLERMLAQLRHNGVTVEKVEDHEYGRFAWITDPEGNRIELYEPKSP